MKENLNIHFLQWIEELSKKKNLPIEQLTQVLAINEIENRITNYPVLKGILTQPRLDLHTMGKKITDDCWASGSRYQKIRFMRAIENDIKARRAIEKFLENFPADDYSAAERMDIFIGQLIDLGYTNKEGRRDFAGAAAICSLLLTALYPSRFVDFLPTRWRTFAERFDYSPAFPHESSYGEKIIWAGKVATELSNTSTFKKYWPQYNPLWIVAGLCWKWHDPYVGDIVSSDIDLPFTAEEGKQRIRSHIYRERNRILMTIVKSERYRIDPLLRCEVCKFSFFEKYGDIGQEFIEGHHKIPLASLEKSQITKPEDIALVCSNCHRMIHRNGESRSIEDMQKRLQ